MVGPSGLKERIHNGSWSSVRLLGYSVYLVESRCDYACYDLPFQELAVIEASKPEDSRLHHAHIEHYKCTPGLLANMASMVCHQYNAFSYFCKYRMLWLLCVSCAENHLVALRHHFGIQMLHVPKSVVVRHFVVRWRLSQLWNCSFLCATDPGFCIRCRQMRRGRCGSITKINHPAMR